jgi:hypothetical protein
MTREAGRALVEERGGDRIGRDFNEASRPSSIENDAAPASHPTRAESRHLRRPEIRALDTTRRTIALGSAAMPAAQQ